MYAHAHTYIHTYIHTQIDRERDRCDVSSLSLCVYILLYIYIYIYIYIYMCVCVCMCVCGGGVCKHTISNKMIVSQYIKSINYIFSVINQILVYALQDYFLFLET